MQKKIVLVIVNPDYDLNGGELCIQCHSQIVIVCVRVLSLNSSVFYQTVSLGTKRLLWGSLLEEEDEDEVEEDDCLR